MHDSIGGGRSIQNTAPTGVIGTALRKESETGSPRYSDCNHTERHEVRKCSRSGY